MKNYFDLFKNKLKHRAFTLMELIVVGIVLSVGASLALSNYNKVIEQNYCHSAIQNMQMIHSGVQIYVAKNHHAPVGANDLNTINQRLNLSIPSDPYFDYFLSYSEQIGASRKNGPNYSCWANGMASLSSTNPNCTDSNICQTPVAP